MICKSDYLLLNGVLVKESTLKELFDFQGLIFDVDGVLVDVRSSFRKAIIQTASFFCRHYIHPALIKKISPSLTKRFKLVPGFNNDWELTYALILSLIVYYETVFQKNYLMDFSTFIHNFLNELNQNGGGLKAARKVFNERIKTNFQDWYTAIPYNQVKTFFQEVYGGKDHCFYLYGFHPQFIKKKGLVNKEILLVSKELLKQFYPHLGLITGRTKKEVSLFLKVSSFQSLFKENAIIHDGKSINKPHPAPLKQLMDTLGLEKAVYIGDVLDDWLMVKRYHKTGKKKKVFGCIVVNTLKESRFFLNQGVDLVASSTVDALNFLLKKRSGKSAKNKN